jgi:pSer/pThr/pTyr-binding forkhead associated (FHA) protein
MPKLTWKVGGETKSVDVTDSCSIGRMPGNTIVLESENGCSRRHCQILKISSGFELADLGSTNGTKVNGQAVKRHKLKDGDEIRIGETALRWSEGTGAPAEDEVALEGDVQLEEPAAPSKASAAGATSEQCYLVFAGGPKDAQKVPLEKKRITFGRNPKNTFVLADDAGVSGYHAEVSREGGAYVLRDLGSTNGTFVDGEQVTEVALQHGNRIRLGATRLVFVDPTVSDFEKAMAAVEDLGSEWGMLRAEMDMTRVQQAKRSQMVAIGGMLVLLAGAGYVAIAHPEVISGREQPPAPVAGNLLSDFSFESQSAGWSPAPGSPAQGRYAEAADGPAYQGRAYYAVSRDGGTGRAAAVAAGERDRVRVNPGSAYEFGARVRTKGDAQACVRITWLAADGVTVVGGSATDLVSASEWTEARRVVAQPPRDAAVAIVELVNAGSGTAYFDDVFVVPAASRPAVPEVKGGDVALTFGYDGQVTLRRASATLLADAAVVAGALRPEALEPGRRPERVGSRKGTTASGGGTSFSVAGQAFDAPRGQWHPFSVKAAIDSERYVDIEAELPEDVAIVATLPKDMVEEGLGVKTDTAFFRLTEPRSIEKVRSVTFGERNRFEVAAAADAEPFRFALVRGNDGWTVAFGATAGKLKVRIDTDSRAIGEGIRVTETAASDAKARRQYGQAIKLLRELAAKLPQGSPQAAAAAKEADDFERTATEEFDRVAAGRVSAEEFQDDAELGSLEVRATALAQQFDGHEVGEKAKAEIDAIRAALAKRRVVLGERKAVPLLARADDCRAREDYALAAAIYRGIVQAYPGTDAARRAKDALEKLPAGK